MAISVETKNESYSFLYIKFPVFAPRCQQSALRKYFHDGLHHTISRKSVQWETRSCACVQAEAH